MCLLYKVITMITICLKVADSTNICKRFFANENYSWWSSDREFYKKFATQYEDEAVARYRDGLVYGSGFPARGPAGGHYECLAPGHLLGRLIWDLQEEQADVSPCAPARRTRMLLLSPHSALPLDARDRAFGTTVVRNTSVNATLWQYEKDDGKSFSEIFHVFDEPVTCSNDSAHREFRVVDGKRIAEEVFTDYLATKPEMFKFFLIVIVKDAPSCLKIRAHYTKELWNGTHEDICYHSPRVYHTAYGALHARAGSERVERAEGSAAPWADDALGRRASVWCRSRRALMALTDVHWFIECSAGDRRVAEKGVITGPTHCSLLVDGARRHVLMHFDEFRYLLTVKARIVSKCHWKIDALEIKYKTRKKGGTLPVAGHDGRAPRAVRFRETMYWANASAGVVIARGCGPHLTLGLIAVEFNDNGVGYNFSNKFY